MGADRRVRGGDRDGAVEAVDARRSTRDRRRRRGRASGSRCVDRDVALAARGRRRRRPRRGAALPLAGTTLAVKDNIDVAGLPTTAGCPAFAYRAGDATRPSVAALVAAGAVVVGKTNLDQFATGLVGVPLAVRRRARTPTGRA